MITSLLVPVFTCPAIAADSADAQEEEAYDYLGEPYPSDKAKLATMTLYFENDDYAIYGLEITGEVGILDKKTGQILLTNPYDVASSKSSDAVKEQLLSQIILTYSDSTGAIVTLNSFSDAAFASEDTKQIHMYQTRTGLRVEYTIGREAVKYIVPRQIEKEDFEKNILSYFEVGSREYSKLTAYYSLKDPNQEGQSQSTIDAMKTKWPITAKYAIYVLDNGVANRELLELEGYIKNTYYDDYSKVEEMYEMLDYVDTSAAPALFRFVIEYNLDDYGIEIRMPASSIRYDSSNYELRSVKFLPYFCAGSNQNTGFTLVPDGSGTITRFEDIGDKAFTLTGRLYGRDYSFHSLSGTTQETMRLPAFGVIETRDASPEISVKPEETPTLEEDEQEEVEEASQEAEDSEEEVTAEEETEEAEETAEAEEAEEVEEAVVEETAPEAEKTAAEKVTSGYVALLVEGDAMAEITADHGGTVHKYSSVYTTFYPKPRDSYVLEGISSTGSAVFTVQSDRRYTGNYTLRVFPIYKDGADYNDMAASVRDYLTETGSLEKITPEKDKSDNVPLYIETFGTIETTKKFAGFPVNVQMPLTTFDQTKEIISELKDNGIDNLNIKLSGWNNGGLRHTAPSKLKVEKAIGGEKGLIDLAEFAEQNNVGIYPDFDFVYVSKLDSFDGFDYKKHSSKTIDNRSASYRKYSPLYQGFEERGAMIISPTALLEFYGRIRDKFMSYGTTGISVATLGSELSSDHNEDYTLNREDVKEIVANALSEMKEDNGSVMVSGGNSYTLPYVDHVLEVPLDSSLNINTSESIPFMGMVLHGNVEFAGTAINLDGDFDYSVLKAIENGASLYFVLSKDNTSELKQYPRFSRYYAIGYDIWKQDLIDTYESFNKSMKKVKYSYITDHKTIGTRVVRVTYENGVTFILNYNTHEIQLSDGTVALPMSFVETDDGEVTLIAGVEED